VQRKANEFSNYLLKREGDSHRKRQARRIGVELGVENKSCWGKSVEWKEDKKRLGVAGDSKTVGGGTAQSEKTE